MHIRIAATGLVAVGLLATLATAGVAATTATATAATAAVVPAPAACAQEHLALLDAEDAIAGVEAVPEVKVAHDALAKAGAAADVDKLSSKTAPQPLGAGAPEADPATAKAMEAYNAAGAKYLQARDAALSKVAPLHRSSRDALKKCLKVGSA
ncbi:hypothetical protein OG884_36415 [Streptosporangium sp. NBC_01755]|uniref:hypothetical protein n=1 Tax=unclassified Streptosporangium TaxID=2632669 RepID=UPI002DD87C75|nr:MULTISPECIES: hypothetical protein [unclassified Streptosporangium]WSA28331.1 hypothetical protein OIE13_10915 [Streptosporangium sp. NBC_01810]WSD00191.1 hypothetical protein OG884_36415 [Streptosporangium sp. NBC_01755]